LIQLVFKILGSFIFQQTTDLGVRLKFYNRQTQTLNNLLVKAHFLKALIQVILIKIIENFMGEVF
jgi:hypothetical protein